MNYGCEGLTAIISGGTSGIGLATAKKLLADGAKVYVLGRSLERGTKALAELEATDNSGVYIPCDISKAESCQKALERVALHAGGKLKLDILVNCAGVYKEQRLESMTEKDYSKIFDVNVKGTMLLTQACLPYMWQGGSIVNVASDAGIAGNYGCPIYCASKGAVVALTKALALDLAPGIRVNCVCPADVATPLLEEQLQAAEGSYTLEDMAEAYPLGRVGKAEEIAHVICSLASPQNSFMTGSVVAVDGGITAKG